MKNVLYLNITRLGFGLTNQIFSFITGVIQAYKTEKTIIIVGDFSTDFSKESYIPISQIFDIDKINTFLKLKYNILIFDKNNVDFKTITVKYGNTIDDAVDITDYVLQNCTGDNILLLSKKMNINRICEDPCVGVSKNVYIDYSINDIIFQYIEKEDCDHLNDDIIFDVSNTNFTEMYNIWIDALDKNIFDDVLKNIHFQDVFIRKSEEFIKTVNIQNNINVMHLRIEPDAITHWSTINKMDIPEYKYIIENKYIGIIEQYVNKSDETIILSYSSSNRVIDYMKKNGYKYRLTPKYENMGREENAIVDLLISKISNNTLIGNFNLENLNGSSFSYYLTQINSDVKQILIDLDNIKNKEYIYHPTFKQCSIPKIYK